MVNGIDTQIMITRLPDNVNQASGLVKRPEIAQEFLATQGKVHDAIDQERVAGTQESEMEQIRTDVDKESQGGSHRDGNEHRKSGKDNKSGQDTDMLVPPGNHRIDIIV